ncbi:non-ribosomal peptide synthetase, partial [Xanthomonas albilineans]|uniref:non-ribosomal peptide synthetase n=5 Tax=Xanthomonas albilineans TaxID=29447 RepID=UPI000D295D59
TMHHIVSDGWSMALLVQELSALYAAFVQGQRDPLPPLPIQYPDYAMWQRRWLDGPLLQRQLGFWREHLHDAPALLELPTDHPRPAVQDYRGDHVDIALDAELTDALRALSQRHGTTVFMTVLAGWAVLLSRLSGQDQVVIGAPVANRTRSELEALIGFFVNAQALRIDLRGAPTVADLLAQVRVTALAAQDHQDVPFEKVIEALNPERSLSAQPVFQVVLTWQNVPEAELVLPDIRLQPIPAQAGDAKFDLEFSLHEQQDHIVGSLGYAKALFERSTIERHLAQFVTLLHGMVADAHVRVAQLPLLPAAERAQLQRFTVTETAPLTPATCIHHLFEAQVQRTPDAIAVSEGQRTLRYAELDARANRLAQRLRRSGVGLESRVALYLPRSIEQVVAVLATLKAGAAYVPLDPELPSERLAFLLEDSRPRAVLTCTDLQDHLPASRAMLRVSVLTLDDIAETQHDDPGAPDIPGLCPDNLAYVIYTSGSTGQPKGTLLTHAGAAHYLQWAIATYRPTPSAVVSSSLSFDATLTSLLAPLLCGAQVELLPDHDTLDALRQRLCDPTPLGLVKLTPAHLEVLGQQLADHPTPLSPAVMVIGGEALPPATLARWQTLAPHTRLINEYGPTETVVGCAVHTTTADDAHASNGRVPIGQPIAHLRLYVLDAHGQHAPIGVAGHLHIAGPQLARGYLGRADLTAERFVPDPFAEQPCQRMYRSGDIACWRADGTLDYLGRNDDQVKLRGFRIELGEIAAALRACAGVQDAVVLLREDHPGEPRLVAYLVGDVDGIALSPEAMRTQLDVRLPDYMLPTAYVQLEALPLTANGKLDRKALPAPDAAAYAARAYEAPQGAIEQTIAAIWGDLLGLETIGRHDNFFALGGHSLLAVTLTERMRQQGLRADLRTLFATPTLAALAAASDAVSVNVPPNQIASDSAVITPEMLPLVTLTQEQIDSIVAILPGGSANLQDIYPLAPLQEGIFFHHLLQRQGDAYLQPNLIAFDSRSRLDGFIDALQRVIDRHDILRTAVAWEGLAAPVQVVWRRAALVIEHLCLDEADGEVAAQLQSRFDPRHWRLDVRQAPLMRGVAAQDPANGRWLLQLLCHHLALDHTTLE